MFKKCLLASAVSIVTVASGAAVAAEETESGFFDGASMDLGIMFYGRQRNAEGDRFTDYVDGKPVDAQVALLS